MNKIKPVVVLDLAFSGYGIVRSLYKYNIPIIGLYKDKFLPESYTRLCSEKIFFRDEKDLLKNLITISEQYISPPILILTTDYYVEFFIQHRVLLSSKFDIDMPDNSVVEMLLDKTKFLSLAKKENILIPPYVEINSKNNLDGIKELKFPIILKPYLRTESWNKKGLKKAYVINNLDEFKKIYIKISKVEPNLIAQEYIEGNDENIEYCLVYYSSKGKCLASFTGVKIRQWPVGIGSTASTTVVDNDIIKRETIRIFDSISYKGFGSIEYKKNLKDGNYYVIEPTVGRTNQQEFVATLCGVNLPLVAYNNFSTSPINFEISSKRIVFIDLLAEIRSFYNLFRKKILTYTAWKESLRGEKAYRLYVKHDKRVFYSLFPYLLIKLFNKIKNEKINLYNIKIFRSPLFF